MVSENDAGKILLAMKLMQQATTEEKYEKAWEQFAVAAGDEFSNQFLKEWANETWLPAWQDCEHEGFREGIWNTNNGAEALFRKLTSMFFHHRTSSAPARMVEIIVRALKHFEFRLAQQDEGIEVLPPSLSKQQLAARMHDAQVLVEKERKEFVKLHTGDIR